MPENGAVLWDWFDDLCGLINRVSNGVPVRLTAVDYQAWADLTGTLVYPHEWTILRAMDGAYCAALAVELADWRARAEQDAKGARGRA